MAGCLLGRKITQKPETFVNNQWAGMFEKKQQHYVYAFMYTVICNSTFVFFFKLVEVYSKFNRNYMYIWIHGKLLETLCNPSSRKLVLTDCDDVTTH